MYCNKGRVTLALYCAIESKHKLWKAWSKWVDLLVSYGFYPSSSHSNILVYSGGYRSKELQPHWGLLPTGAVRGAVNAQCNYDWPHVLFHQIPTIRISNEHEYTKLAMVRQSTSEKCLYKNVASKWHKKSKPKSQGSLNYKKKKKIKFFSNYH